ncbi:hypothetical protein [Planctomycetes bacterium TBK1r]|uniref:Secreted protein n=1 Tax=Stieleria magnilauensis TaxID=2527963 RepID=A0ABX5XSN4_9BACT|nr:hypothetical protein TBK1r_35980 [Planctomycetes bacterium TBK1r]
MNKLKIGTCVGLCVLLIGSAAAVAMAPVPATETLDLAEAVSLSENPSDVAEAELLQDWEFTARRTRCGIFTPGGF